jgi:HEPN domain-containing protein
MRNPDLARDYVQRATVRLEALKVLSAAGSWADVVRESQEIVELALRGLLQASGVQPPRIHDVSEILIAERAGLPEALRGEVERLAEASLQLRRDRELAFYGAEDLTPSGFYSADDAHRAQASAQLVVSLVRPHVPGGDLGLPGSDERRR